MPVGRVVVSAWLSDCRTRLPGMLAKPSSSFAFPRSARLTIATEFQRVLRHGRRIHVDELMAVVHRSDTAAPRLGLAIVKRHVRRAHERNRIKRIAREYFRHQQALLPPVDCVLMVKPGADGLSNDELRQRMESLFQLVIRRCSAGC
ncbi:ribonuclease P protein component [Halothiobacillus sp. DCM-1]|uniref:ribonuclease P protein component n=1 Tax=Halothiobacillus sp. DCM-1 TaxID=3112558 RepID=UPI00324B9C3E